MHRTTAAILNSAVRGPHAWHTTTPTPEWRENGQGRSIHGCVQQQCIFTFPNIGSNIQQPSQSTSQLQITVWLASFTVWSSNKDKAAHHTITLDPSAHCEVHYGCLRSPTQGKTPRPVTLSQYSCAPPPPCLVTSRSLQPISLVTLRPYSGSSSRPTITTGSPNLIYDIYMVAALRHLTAACAAHDGQFTPAFHWLLNVSAVLDGWLHAAPGFSVISYSK